ncbi:MAG: hypothetical protein A2V83_05725 [Nitrospirae bacterium RBG_16_64_22]|nr:MAG: hypothetical protein A2V83_05725 [Nitrospirae bacterium RBG_16_64_22]
MSDEPSPIADGEALRDENRRVRAAQIIVSFAMLKLKTLRLTEGEADEMIEGARARVLQMFPEGGSTFDLIYRPRLERLRNENEFVRLSRAASQSGR